LEIVLYLNSTLKFLSVYLHFNTVYIVPYALQCDTRGIKFVSTFKFGQKHTTIRETSVMHVFLCTSCTLLTRYLTVLECIFNISHWEKKRRRRRRRKKALPTRVKNSFGFQH